jgi:hypothetical protein
MDQDIGENFAKQIIKDFLIDYPEYSMVLNSDKNYNIIVKNLKLVDKSEL